MEPSTVELLFKMEQQRKMLRKIKFPDYVDNMFVFLSLAQRWTAEKVKLHKSMQVQGPSLNPRAALSLAKALDQELIPGASILEIGCGTGQISCLLYKQMTSQHRWLATDIILEQNNHF